MSNSRITVQQYIEDSYQTLTEKRACSIYWDHFNVEHVTPIGKEYFIQYGTEASCYTPAHTMFNVRWHSEIDYLAMQLKYAEIALEEAKNTLRLVHDLAQGARNSIGATNSASDDIVLTLTNIDKWSFEQYLKLGKSY